MSMQPTKRIRQRVARTRLDSDMEVERGPAPGAAARARLRSGSGSGSGYGSGYGSGTALEEEEEETEEDGVDEGAATWPPAAVSQLCSRCKQHFNPLVDARNCVHHPGFFSGETAQRWMAPGETQGASTMHYFWSCCGAADASHPGCERTSHTSYDDQAFQNSLPGGMSPRRHVA